MCNSECYIIAALIICVESVPVAAQLADTAWPVFHHDLNHTGLSTYYGPDTSTVKWTFPTQDRISGSSAISEDGIIYIVPDGTSPVIDSIIKYKVASADALALTEVHLPLTDLSIGQYTVVAVSNLGFVNTNPVLLRVVDDATPPVVMLEGDSVIQGNTIIATSTKDGMLYLVIVGTSADLSEIRNPALFRDSLAATANIPVEFATSDLDAVNYWLYAVDIYGIISESGNGSVGKNILPEKIKEETLEKFFQSQAKENKDKPVRSIISNAGKPAHNVLQAKHYDAGKQIKLSKETKDVFKKAAVTASSFGHKYIGTEHLIFGIFSQKNLAICSFLKKEGVNIEKVLELAKVFLESASNFSDMIDILNSDFSGKTLRVGAMAKSQNQFSAKPISASSRQKETLALNYFCVDLTAQAEKGKFDPVIAREKEIGQAINILSRRIKNNSKYQSSNSWSWWPRWVYC